MKEFKGTKGKWEYDEFDVYTEYNGGNSGNIICEAPEQYRNSMKNWKANAKLIASAPELLETLQKARLSIEKAHAVLESKNVICNKSILKEINEAINKAL